MYILCLIATDPRFREFWPAISPPALPVVSSANSKSSDSTDESSTTAGEESTPSTSDGSSDRSSKKITEEVYKEVAGEVEVATKGAVEAPPADSSKNAQDGVDKTENDKKKDETSKSKATGEAENKDSTSASSVTKSSSSSSSSCKVAAEIDFSAIPYGERPASNAQAFPPEFHPAGAAVFGWPSSIEKNSFVQKACYKKIGKRVVKQKKPFLMFPLGGKDVPIEKQKEVLEFFGELRDAKKSESAERIALFFLSGSIFQEKLKVFIAHSTRN